MNHKLQSEFTLAYRPNPLKVGYRETFKTRVTLGESNAFVKAMIQGEVMRQQNRYAKAFRVSNN